MGSFLVPLIIAVSIVTIVAIDNINKIVIKKEQIRADAMVRAEEVKAKNQLELEKLMRQDNIRQNESHFTETEDNRTIREHRNA
jgi:hypothetical protein